ncbi:hypothetical protein VIGAN_11087500, partial [Vigna angularis var. angularis]
KTCLLECSLSLSHSGIVIIYSSTTFSTPKPILLQLVSFHSPKLSLTGFFLLLFRLKHLLIFSHCSLQLLTPVFVNSINNSCEESANE